MKKILSCVIAALLILTVSVPALAADIQSGDRRVTIGADLTEAQVGKIYDYFGLKQGDVEEIKVTNKEERSYLEGLVSEKKIGNVALSCCYLTVLDKDQGLTVSTNNINWCTEKMYKNALVTAGITDASVMITAPRPVSGTAALTGIYKAYEDITGKSLDSLAKQVGAQELVVTGDLGDEIGNAEISSDIVNQLKTILDKTKGMSDDEVREQIKTIGKQYGQDLTDSQIEQLLKLVRSLEGLNTSELESRLKSLQDAYKTATQAGSFFSDLGQKISDFFKSVGEFFTNLFGGGK